jgi:hypothetical protein
MPLRLPTDGLWDVPGASFEAVIPTANVVKLTGHEIYRTPDLHFDDSQNALTLHSRRASHGLGSSEPLTQ